MGKTYSKKESGSVLKKENKIVAAETQPAETPASASHSDFKKKLNSLWRDDRGYPKRLVLSLFVLFAACFTFFFFGPMEITAFGQASLIFSMRMVLPIMAVFTVAVFAAAALVVALLRGKIFNYVLTALFSLLVCGYLQGNFLNGRIGALTGASIQWEIQKTSVLRNLLIWLLIFLVPFVILYFSKNIWKKVLLYGSAAIVVMQSVAFITIFTGGTADTAANKTNYLTTKEEAAYSSKHNTLIFLLDRLDYDHIEEIQKEDPSFFNKLDGFTSYNNAISELTRTKPAINYLFTNCDLIWKVPQEQYLETSWDYQGRNLLKDVKANNYTLDFYTDLDLLFGSGKTVKGEVSNLSSNEHRLNPKSVIKNLSSLSAYRYMPLTLKPFFWCYTDDVNSNVYEGGERYQIDETQYDRLTNFTTTDKTNYFKYYHFMGSHNPYTVNANGIRTGKTDVISQTKGNFHILYRAFDKLKKLGIYKSSTILILGDHGEPLNDYVPLKKANRIGFFYKPAGSGDTPLKTSHAPVSFKNVPASLAKSAGVKDYHRYGKPIEEVGENDRVTRYFYKPVLDGGREKYVYVYQIDGDSAYFKNWKQIRIDYPSPAASFWS